MMKLSKYLYNDHHNTQSTINKVLVFQGDDMLHEIYYNIGVVEVQTVTICKKGLHFCYNISETSVTICYKWFHFSVSTLACEVQTDIGNKWFHFSASRFKIKSTWPNSWSTCTRSSTSQGWVGLFQESILGTFWPTTCLYLFCLSNSFPSRWPRLCCCYVYHILLLHKQDSQFSRLKHLIISKSVSSRWPSGVGAMVASSLPQFSLQMLIRATSSRSRVVFSDLLYCCEFEIISSYLFLVRHQCCPCDQLDLLWLHLHWEVGPRLTSCSNLFLTCTTLLTSQVQFKRVESYWRPRFCILKVPWPAHTWGQLGWLPEERRHCQGDITWIEVQVENSHHVWH